jgi:hypothetical protein
LRRKGCGNGGLQLRQGSKFDLRLANFAIATVAAADIVAWDSARVRPRRSFRLAGQRVHPEWMSASAE